MGETDELTVDLQVSSMFLFFVLFEGYVEGAWALGDFTAESADKSLKGKASRGREG